MSWFIQAVFGLLTVFIISGFKPFAQWRLRNIPGPRPIWYLGNLIAMQKAGSYKFSQICARKYGQVFKVWGPMWPNIVFTAPADVRSMLMHNHNRPAFPSLLPDSSTDKEFEDSMILRARDDMWRGVRQAWTPLFFTGSLEAYSQLMHECSGDLVRRLEGAAADGKTAVDIWSIVGDTTMHVIGTAAFGVDFNTQADASRLTPEEQQKVEELRSCVKYMFKASVGPAASRWFWALLFLPPAFVPLIRMLAKRFPDDRFKRAYNARRTMIELSTDLVKNHRRNLAASAGNASGQLPSGADAGGHADVQIKSSSISSKAESGKGSAAFSNGGLRGGVLPGSFIDIMAFTGILAGYETTANALSFCVYCLSAHPGKLAPLLKEVDAFGDRLPQYEDLDLHFPYLDAALKESMRLYPPATFAVREANQDQVIGGYCFGKGEILSASIYTMHHDQDLWGDNVEDFVPERWLEGSPEEEKSRKSWLIPFGEGPRKCPAARFAIEEAKIILFRLYQKFTFELEPGQIPLKVRHTITLSPKDGIRVIVRPRGKP
ncbi:hypothetical protein WJX73_010382 [Symbiochloris irregularis]|uniref:Cytochrome P450 n=1 Tax=Symbiochloris irregularis TaxID=706552 RepID=A0AAW1P7W1_9CHLO